MANRQLPYENFLGETFTEWKTIVEQDGFKVMHAKGPRVQAILKEQRGGKRRR